MRSMKLLVAMAVVAAFVAGPVMAQDSTMAPAGGSSMSSDSGSMSKTTTGKGKHSKKGGKHKKKSSSGSMGSTTTGQ